MVLFLVVRDRGFVRVLFYQKLGVVGWLSGW